MVITKAGMQNYFDTAFIEKICNIAQVTSTDDVTFISNKEPPSIKNKSTLITQEGISVIDKFYATQLVGIVAFNEYGRKIDMSIAKFGKWKSTPYVVTVSRYDVETETNYVYVWNMSTAAVAKAISESYIHLIKTINAIAKTDSPVIDIIKTLRSVYSGIWKYKKIEEVDLAIHSKELTTSSVVLKIGNNFIYAHDVPIIKEFSGVIQQML